MNILIFGKNGQVGWELCRSFLSVGNVVAYGSKDADFSDPESLRMVVRSCKPDIIINAAAYTNVAKAEKETELAIKVNGISPGVLAEEAAKINALFIHYSTDYVFDGESQDLYLETSKVNPINQYGHSKLIGENHIVNSNCDWIIFRTSWVFASRGNNFLRTISKLMFEKEVVNVVDDQFGTPTWARLIADVTMRCAVKAFKKKLNSEFKSDIYNLACREKTSWYDFAKEIYEYQVKTSFVNNEEKACDLRPISTKEYGDSVSRPLNTALSVEKLESTYNIILPVWRDCVHLCMDEMASYS